MFTRHLAQPPQQEAHADAGRSGEVELVAQGGRQHKIIHVWRDGVEHRRSVVEGSIIHFLPLEGSGEYL